MHIYLFRKMIVCIMCYPVQIRINTVHVLKNEHVFLVAPAIDATFCVDI